MRPSNPEVLHFLQTRRSRPAKTLTTPVPSNAELEPILTAALRSPDHGKLEPWRLMVLNRAALVRLSTMVAPRAAALHIEADKTQKMVNQFANAHLAVAVISSPVAVEKIPEFEQLLSAGAVCLALLNAALAAGWGANWLSGWASHDPVFCSEQLGLAGHERLAGFIHIGTETAPPPERPRPVLQSKVTWIDA